MLLLFFSKKTILQQRGRRLLIPHTPDITITPEAPHIRQFESIGGRGDSVLVCTEEIDDKFSALPQLNSARHVLGVLYS